MMASYRLLQDHFVAGAGGRVLSAGQVVTTGKELPTGYVPTPNMEPMDVAATQAMWDAGPVLPGYLNVSTPPVTHWQQLGSTGFWQLQGLGASLAPRWAWRI
jgi:hypothetical protein